MSTLAYSPHPAFGQPHALGARLRRQAGPLAAIVLAHALFFYMVYSGLLHRLVQVALPAAVMVSFVDTPASSAPPAAPKLVALATLAPPALPQITPVAIALPDAIALPAVAASSAVAAVAAPAAAADPAPQRAAPAAVAAPSAPRLLATGVEYLLAPQPVYPQMSRRMGEQGKVVLRILVSAKGLPDQVSVETSSGFSRLDDAARQAALRAQFKPHLEDGRPVAVFIIVPLSFSLAG